MRVVVTGGVGFIGSYVCQKLLTQGHEVHCIDNFNDYYNWATGDSQFSKRKNRTLQELLSVPDFHLACAKTSSNVDIRDYSSLRQAFPPEVDAVIHLAALAGVRYSKDRLHEYRETNVQGTRCVIDAAREFGVKRVVIASSSSVYAGNKTIPFKETDALSPAPNNYALSKQEMETMCKEIIQPDEKIALLRFFSVYGPRGRPDMAVHLLADSALKGKPFTKKGDGEDARDWTYVDDIADGIIRAATFEQERPIEAYNLGNSMPVTLNKLIELTETYAGQPCIIRQGEKDSSEMRITCASTEKARNLLDWTARTSIETGLKSFYDWYKKNELTEK